MRVVGFGVFSGMETNQQRRAALCFEIQIVNMISLSQHMSVNFNKLFFFASHFEPIEVMRKKKMEGQRRGPFWTLSKHCVLPQWKVFSNIIILPRSARQATLTIPISANTQTQTEPVKAHRFHSAPYFTQLSSSGAERFTIQQNPPPYVMFTDYNRVQFKGRLILPNLVMSPTLLQEMNAAAWVCAGLLARTGCPVVIDAVI